MQIGQWQGIINLGIFYKENQMTDIENSSKRRRRVKRLKRAIIAVFFLALIIPTAISLVLGVRLHSQGRELGRIGKAYDEQLTLNQKLQEKLDEEKNLRIAAQAELSEAAVALNIDSITDSEVTEDVKKVYLTFDDGPSIYTEQILDILDEYGVKATFFVTGEAGLENADRYAMITERGHTIGMHSFTHRYSEIYGSEEGFISDFTRIKEFLQNITGVTPVIYRFPGGSSNRVSSTDMNKLFDFLKENDVQYFDWNVSSGDASVQTLSTERIVSNCMLGIEQHGTSIVLFHDTSAKYTTVAALPIILENLSQMEDVEILPITKETEVIQHRKSEE